MNSIEHFIDGKTVKGTSKRTAKVFNPATGEVSSNVNLASTSDLNKAVDAAKKAFPSWSEKTPLFRARVLFKFKELIEKNYDELTKIIVSEHGKVYEDAKGSLTRGLEVVEFACGIPQLLKGEFTENVGTNVDSWSMRQPLGVCAGITPFNFPAMVPMWMFPIAIACGNTFVLKPSEKDPSCSMKLAELFLEAGLPPGVFNVVNGDKEAVDAIINNKDIAAVSFVGSTPIAKYIYENCAKNEKRVQALGGAKNHCVVMPDCDLDQAVNGLMGAAYGSAGERCMAQSVAVAVGKIADPLVESLSKKVGNGTSIFTRDGDTGRSFASNVKIGMVGINIPIPVPMAFHSFGGWKRSLFGDQSIHGPEGVRFYTKLKTITSRWPSGIKSDPEFVMPTMK